MISQVCFVNAGQCFAAKFEPNIKLSICEQCGWQRGLCSLTLANIVWLGYKFKSLVKLCLSDSKLYNIYDWYGFTVHVVINMHTVD